MSPGLSPDLPADLRHALDRLVEGRPRGDSRRDIARRAAAISAAYRGGGGSEAIRDADDALAYALARMPGTYAAAAAVLSALAEAWPDFAPRSLLDLGAGPATASFAAAHLYAALRQIALLDHNPHLRALGRTLLAAGEREALRDAAYDLGDAVTAPPRPPADLVLASYVLGELAPDRRAAAADALWSATGGALAVIEPGTPAGFARIAAARAQLIERGAHVLAPCPHAHPCPVVAPDWCHFARRLARSRAHRQAKGAALAFEDEKFAYVVLAREPPPAKLAARVVAMPQAGKAAVTAKLCTRAGTIETAAVPRRDRAAYRAARGWRWGDAIDQRSDTNG